MATRPALPAETSQPPRLLPGTLPPAAVLLATLLSTAGLGSIWPTALTLYAMWVNDPLKSIGMFVPLVSLVLILRVWRSLGWRMDGTWWGFALLLATAAAVRFREQSVLVLILSPRWSVYFPPHSLVALAYVTGCVLLFGGWQLLRAARFPVLLTLLTNPVPHVFNVYVDLPLQRVSAHVARGFAHALHQKLTPDQMRLMFTPDFGMFIAPGCNGIRGAVTMGMIALVAGYLFRFRWRAHLLFVVAAVLLGYLFNFVRLCTLVLYYIVALKIPWLQDRAELGDYLLGAALFLAAVALLFWTVRRVARPEPEPLPLPTAAPARGIPAHLLAMALLALVSGIHAQRAQARTQAIFNRHFTASTAFPATLGPYTRDRTWVEQMTGGPVLFDWAEYTLPTPAAGNTSLTGANRIALGLSPTLGSHDASVCHSARGEDPLWHGELTLPTAAGLQTFSTSFFNNGATQYLELSTSCTTTGCAEYTVGNGHLGLIYTRPTAGLAADPDALRTIPVMLRIETTDTAMPADLARTELLVRARAFLTATDLVAITRASR